MIEYAPVVDGATAKSRPVSVALLLALALSVVTACDRGGDETVPTAEWVERADAICAEVDADLDEIPEPTKFTAIQDPPS